jgi:hypothetical protein
VSLQGSKKPRQQTDSALPGPAGYEPAGLIFLTISQADRIPLRINKWHSALVPDGAKWQ